jgi:hypothetical protein
VTQKSRTPWKPIAIILALILAALSLLVVLMITDVMKFGFSLI